MAIVKIWVYAIGAIVTIVLSWYIITPIYYNIKAALDTAIFDNLYGVGKTVYNTLNFYTGSILNVSVIIFVLVIIVWALMRSQSKERYTGRYRR